MDIEKQLGLGYLGRRGTADRTRRDDPRGSRSELDPVETLTAYGRPIMKQVAQNGGLVRLYSVIDQLQMPINIALPVVEFLEQQDFLEVVQRDLKGDHEVRLTRRGRAMID